MEATETPVTESGFALDALLHNADTWIAVSFAIFLAVFLKYLVPLITKGLDQRAAAIRTQLEQASQLRAQAEELLATYQRERAEKEREAESILANAKIEAEQMRVRAAEELKQSLERRSQQAIEKIARAEVEAVAEVRTQMLNLASQAVSEIIRKQLASGTKEDPAIARAIATIERQIH